MLGNNDRIEMRNFSKWICLLLAVLFILMGCMLRTKERKHEDSDGKEYIFTIQHNADFIKENIENLNHMYLEEYQLHPYPFIVETETGSTIIQNLIDKHIVMRQIEYLDLGSLNKNERILEIYNYVLTEYDYVIEPKRWPTIYETVKWKKGDCKGLSLLLMSLLLASDFDAHAEISNGHMWVTVYNGGTRHVLELDTDPENSLIYNIPGFYDMPLFKIYEDRTEKRLRKQ
jgi:hypothetical protein